MGFCEHLRIKTISEYRPFRQHYYRYIFKWLVDSEISYVKFVLASLGGGLNSEVGPLYTFLSGEILHDCERYTSHVYSTPRKLERERLVEHWAAGLLGDLGLLGLEDFPLLHDAHLHVEICSGKADVRTGSWDTLYGTTTITTNNNKNNNNSSRSRSSSGDVNSRNWD